jgi:hypothetical protein
MEKINYHGWPESVRLANEAIELVALTVVGPRIIRLAFLGGENMLNEIAETRGKIGPPDQWTIYGGHRLWHAPEISGRTDAPDSDPMEAVTWEKNTVSLVAKTEKATGIQKEMRVTLGAGLSTAVKVEHLLTNHNLWPVELAPWGLTVVAPGGRVILPQEPYQAHGQKGNFLPARPLVLWPYTDMSDLRWRWGKNYIQLHADEALAHPQKIGIYNSHGWGAYERKLEGDLLVIFTQPDLRGASAYPDYGSNFETYTAKEFQELETLGPTERLEPEQTATHTEYWILFKAACLPDADEELAQILPALIAEGHAAIQASFFIKKLRATEPPELVPSAYRIPQLPAE